MMIVCCSAIDEGLEGVHSQLSGASHQLLKWHVTLLASAKPWQQPLTWGPGLSTTCLRSCSLSGSHGGARKCRPACPSRGAPRSTKSEGYRTYLGIRLHSQKCLNFEPSWQPCLVPTSAMPDLISCQHASLTTTSSAS